jgi:hypothetical protein
MLLAEVSIGQVFLTMLYFFLFALWIWMVLAILADVFRSDQPGWAKAMWTLLVIVLPLLGVLAYLIARGSEMNESAGAAAPYRGGMFDDYVGYPSPGPQDAGRLPGSAWDY